MKIVSLATLLSFQAPELVNKYENEEFLVVSPLVDDKLKNAKFIKCEVDSLSYVLAFACMYSVGGEFFDDLDEGELGGESNVDSEEIEELCGYFTDCSKCIVSNENFRGANSSQIKAMLNLLSQKLDFDIVNLDDEKIELEGELSEFDELEPFNGAVLFTHNKCDEFRGGEYFSMAAKIRQGDSFNLTIQDKNIQASFVLDKNLKGTIGFLGADNLEYGFEVFKK